MAQSAYRSGKGEARLRLLITPMDITNGDNTNNEPERGNEQQKTSWTSRGRSEEAEGN